MGDINKLARQTLDHVLSNQGVSNVTPKPAAPLNVPVSNPEAFARVLNQKPAPSVLDSNLLEGPLQQASTLTLQTNSYHVPRPEALNQVNQLNHGLQELSNQDLIDTLMQGKNTNGTSRFQSVNRNAQQIENSGILQALKELDSRQIQVPASEYDRTIADDSVLVMKDLAKLSAPDIHKLKESAYQHPERAEELEGAIGKKYYGSAKHKEFGALVESMTGGVISAEEAMSMCPCGGIPGAGASEVPLIGNIDAVARHAMRHDACGFLLTRFGVGPGYGSPTTPLGLNNSNPLAGQILGIAREMFNVSSEIPDGQHVAKPERFNV